MPGFISFFKPWLIHAQKATTLLLSGKTFFSGENLIHWNYESNRSQLWRQFNDIYVGFWGQFRKLKLTFNCSQGIQCLGRCNWDRLVKTTRRNYTYHGFKVDLLVIYIKRRKKEEKKRVLFEKQAKRRLIQHIVARMMWWFSYSFDTLNSHLPYPLHAIVSILDSVRFFDFFQINFCL